MIPGAHTFGFVWRNTPEEAFDAIGRCGVRHVQVMASAPHFDPWVEDAARTQRLRAAMDRNGQVALALDLASNDVNLASPATEVVAFAEASYTRLMARALELDMPWICIGSGRRHALLPQVNGQLMEPFRAVFARLHDTAAGQGLRLALENHPQGLLASAAEMTAFLDAEGYDDVDVIYDVANAAAIGEDPVAGLAVIGRRLRIVHLSDAPRGEWRHDPIGSGAIDFAAIAGALRAADYRHHAVLEIMGDDPEGGLADGIARLRALGFPLG